MFESLSLRQNTLMETTLYGALSDPAGNSGQCRVTQIAEFSE